MYRTARTTPLSRAFLVAEAERIGVTRAARNMGVSRRTVQRWRRRAPDFADRPCRPHCSPRRSSDVLEARVLALRMELRWGPDRIGPSLGIPVSTVHRILRRHQAHRLRHMRPRRVLSDNGNGYKLRFDVACARLGIRHTRTRPYHPWTNGRVERFNGTIPARVPLRRKLLAQRG